MNRIDARFSKLLTEGRKGLIPYLTAGAPEKDWTVPLMHSLVDAGADLIELGMPFSDPVADGPVIQQACDRALANAIGLRDIFSMVRAFREHDSITPLILMGYLNPIEQFGVDTFVAQACEHGVDGLLIVDLPLDEQLDTRDLCLVRLVSPTTSTERMAKIAEHAKGFVYYVSLKGVTGAANLDTEALGEQVRLLRQSSALPVAVGFGINSAQHASSVARLADAIVVGSALVKNIQGAGSLEAAQAALRECLEPLRTALDTPETVY